MVAGLEGGAPIITSELEQAVNDWLNTISGLTSDVNAIVEPFKGSLKPIFDTIILAIEQVSPNAAKAFKSMVDGIFSIADNIMPELYKRMPPDEWTKWIAPKEMIGEIDKIYALIFGKQEEWLDSMLDNWNNFFEGIGYDRQFDSFYEVTEWLKSLPPEVQEALSQWKKEWEDAIVETIGFWESLGTATKDYFGTLTNWLGSAIDGFTEVIQGTKTWGEALLDFAYKIPLVGGLLESIVDLGKAIIAEWDGSAQAARDLEAEMESIGTATDRLSEAFKDIGASLSGSLEDAQRTMKDIIQSQEDLQLNTREKLIKELDNYYDYRELREMDLTQLLELAAETRGKIETGTLKEIADTAEETAEREKDAKVSTLQAIEDAYAKESELIDKKLKLIEIEIKLLIASGEAEKGNLELAEKMRKEANLDLTRLLYT